MITLRELFSKAYPDSVPEASLPDLAVSGVECDSRKVRPGFLFVAVRGVKEDGNAFIGEALAKGAVAVAGDRDGCFPAHGRVPFILLPDSRTGVARLAAAFYGNPSDRMEVVGITGTNGKTTSGYLIEHLLERQARSVGVLGTVNYRFGGHEIPALETTPGPLRLQELLARMAEAGCRYAVMEVSSHALDQHRTAGIRFGSALFTNLTQDHLDYHRSMEAYFESKSRLFSGLGPGASAVLNADDDWAEKLKKKVRSKIRTYGIRAEADLGAAGIRQDLHSTRFDLLFRGKKTAVQMPLMGFHNVYNALAALAVMRSLGFDPRECALSLADFKGVPGRLEAVSCGQDFLVFVDFAHTPDGFQNVLKSLLPYRKRKLIALFGCGGDRDRAKRPLMGKIACELCDFVFLTSDNPRSEDPRRIAEEVRAGFPPDFKNAAVILDRRKAIRQALLSAREGDIVLLAGKGHERSQIIGTEGIPFSDRQEAEKVLRGH